MVKFCEDSSREFLEECLDRNTDPLNKNQHEPGAKLDKGKPRPWLVRYGFRNALKELWNNGTFGANKYSDYGWESVPNAKERYLNAHERHIDAYSTEGMRDKESNTHHLVAAAWNLLAVAELELRKELKEE